MARALSLLFAIAAYAIFFATFLYLIAFVGDITYENLIPRTVDSPVTSLTLGTAVLINVALIALFGVQHSVMARKGFKRAWTRIVPEPIERSTYVLLASAVLIIMYANWQPIEGTIWSVTNPIGAGVLWALFAFPLFLILVCRLGARACTANPSFSPNWVSTEP